MSSIKFENLVEMFERSVKAYAPRELFGTKKNGQWVWTTYAEVGRLVDDFRGGLASLGIQRGDRVCIISNNRVEWAVVAYACMGLGVAVVPMYEAQLAKEWAFIADDCGAVAVIAATKEIFEKTKELPEKAPSVKHLIGLALPKSDPASYEAILEAGAKSPVPSIHPEAKETSCFIYTSGTTGNPKGVILSHGNLVSNVNAVQDCFPSAATTGASRSSRGRTRSATRASCTACSRGARRWRSARRSTRSSPTSPRCAPRC